LWVRVHKLLSLYSSACLRDTDTDSLLPVLLISFIRNIIYLCYCWHRFLVSARKVLYGDKGQQAAAHHIISTKLYRFWERLEQTLASVLHHKCHFISMSEPCCYVHQRIRRSPDVRRRRVCLWTPRRGHWNAIACSGMWSSLSRTWGKA